MKNMAELLQQHPFATDLDDAVVDLIAGCASNVLFHAGDYIFREHEEADHFYLVRDGTVALETFVPGRGAINFLTVKSGEILGASWLVPPYRWTHDARAVELTRAIGFDCVCLRERCDRNPRLGYALMKSLVPTLIERMQAALLQTADLYRAGAS